MTTRDETSRARLEAVFQGRTPDRTPVLGGWIACPEHIQALAGASREEYWADPVGTSIRAYHALGVDGLVDLFVPKSQDDFRCVDASTYIHAQTDLSLEDAVARVDAMPSAEEIEAQFDFEGSYQAFRAELVDMQARCGGMVWMPAQWSAGACISWYGDLGYESFFLIVGGYRRQAQKLLEVGGARGRCRSRLIARAVREGLFPHAVLLGEDICTQRGPMVSPAFMERYYAPQLRYGLQPLLEAECKPVWHCDGDVRPMLDMLLDCGVQGLQGFQPECGMTIDWVVQKRTREGRRLLIFGPLAVTTELPRCTPEEIRARVHHAIEVSRGNADLVLFTANTINPDVPLANIRAMVEAAREA
ncbi:MAG: uroporphyrinogen decarboxylase family protein [Anaerolineae bacterium]|nr:uroporphyrinogen decarboxylase family protein [Anaerolineae bacterium]